MIEVEEMKNLYRDEFETVFGVKKNIQALRDKVLDLAFRGELVAQNPDDEPATVALERIIAKKASTKNKRTKTYNNDLGPTIKNMPNGWVSVSLGDILSVSSGKSLTRNKMKNGKIPVYGGNGIAGYHDEPNLVEPTIIIGRVGFYCGSIHVVREEAWVTDNALIVNFPTKEINIGYLAWLLKYLKLGEKSNSTAQPVISGKTIYPMSAPLPPIEEQQRILDKIENLMKNLDKLEEQLEEKEKLEVLIPKAVVTALSNSQDEEKLKKNLALVIENFTEVFQTPESLEEFRGVILRLAFQGRLLPQNTVNESAHILLEEIQKNMNVNKRTSLKKEETLFEIPENWIWTRLEDITELTMGQSPPGSTVSDAGKGIEFHQGKKNFGDIYLEFSDKTTSGPKKVVDEDTLLLSVRAPVGNLNITPRKISIGRGLCGINGYSGISSKFLYYFIQNLQPVMEEKSTGTTFKAISGVVIKKLPVPLPPLQEQKRIVAKIESIFAVVDQLEEEMKRRDRIVETMAII